MAAKNTTDDAPTATEFIPADENGVRVDEGPGVRYLQATGDKGTEIVNEESYDDEVLNHCYICDECGHEEFSESDMGHHLHFAHVVD